ARGGGGRRAGILHVVLRRGHFGFSLRRAGIVGRGGRNRAVFCGLLFGCCFTPWFCPRPLRCARRAVLVFFRRSRLLTARFLFRFGIGRRLGGRCRRLGAGIDEHRFALLLQRGGALRLGGVQARKENGVGRLGIVVGHHVVLVLGRRPLAVRAAHFVAQ